MVIETYYFNNVWHLMLTTYIVCCRISKMKQCSNLLKTALAYTISVCQAVLIWQMHHSLFLHSSATCWAPSRWPVAHSSQTQASRPLQGWVQAVLRDGGHKEWWIIGYSIINKKKMLYISTCKIPCTQDKPPLPCFCGGNFWGIHMKFLFAFLNRPLPPIFS